MTFIFTGISHITFHILLHRSTYSSGIRSPASLAILIRVVSCRVYTQNPQIHHCMWIDATQDFRACTPLHNTHTQGAGTRVMVIGVSELLPVPEGLVKLPSFTICLDFKASDITCQNHLCHLNDCGSHQRFISVTSWPVRGFLECVISKQWLANTFRLRRWVMSLKGYLKDRLRHRVYVFIEYADVSSFRTMTGRRCLFNPVPGWWLVHPQSRGRTEDN